MEALSLRIEKTKFFIWAKRLSITPPNNGTLELWRETVRFSKETTTADLMGKLPHILAKDRQEFWWSFPNNYSFMYGLSRALKPVSYLEIGTRYGYSMVSIYSGAKDTLRSITSIDLQEYEDKSQN